MVQKKSPAESAHKPSKLKKTSRDMLALDSATSTGTDGRRVLLYLLELLNSTLIDTTTFVDQVA